MDLRKRFATDKSREEHGVWIPLSDTSRVKLARIGHPGYEKAMAKKAEPYRHAIRTKCLSDETAERLLIEALAETILLDWEGFTLDGEPYPYSYDHAVRILTELPDFREAIVQMASDLATFRAQEEEMAIKN